jgi:quercetin dioxygenase-like cupin family protein
MKTLVRTIEAHKGVLYAITLAVGIALGTIGSGVLAQDGDSSEPVVQQELMRTSVESQDGPKIVWVRRVELAPDVAMSSEPDIEHPAQEFVYVLDGTATLIRSGEDPLEFTAGEAWHNDFEEAHTLQNASSTEHLAVIAVWIGEEGAF